MPDTRTSPPVDIVSAVLTHVSLMIAGLALIFQIAERLAPNIYNTANACKLDITRLKDGTFRCGTDLQTYVSGAQHFMLYAIPKFVDVATVAVLLAYLIIALQCLRLLRRTDITPRNVNIVTLQAQFSTVASVAFIIAILLSSPLYSAL